MPILTSEQIDNAVDRLRGLPRGTTRYDPTRTTLLRRQFIRDITKRFRELDRTIRKAVVTKDMLALEENPQKQDLRKQGFQILQATPRFQFATDAAKLVAFQKWLKDQIKKGILQVDGLGQSWTNRHIHSAYLKGVTRAWIDSHKKMYAIAAPIYYTGSRDQFLRSAFNQPIVKDKLQLIYTRAYDQLDGITAAMSQNIGRIMATGLASGHGPLKIAREISKNISGISRRRARTLARTEVIYAHAEGQLDSYQLMGAEKVGIMAEWSTAGDERVCSECGAYEGETMTVSEAHGMIPLHPNCRCAWIPAVS